jgi:hypothetical protein
MAYKLCYLAYQLCYLANKLCYLANRLCYLANRLRYLADELPEDKTDDVSRLPVAGVEEVGQRVGRKVGQSY